MPGCHEAGNGRSGVLVSWSHRALRQGRTEIPDRGQQLSAPGRLAAGDVPAGDDARADYGW
jgi:hypothetical protein